MIHPPGALAKLATPHLLHCVTNDSVPAAVMSLRALAELNREITWVIPSLTGILQHPNVTTNPMVMQYALNTIGYFGRRAGENSNLVIPFLTNPNPTIAREATNALRALSERP
jgi:hypothetical protein